jgi:hypothetical protein
MFVKFLDVEDDGAYDFIMDPQWPVIAKAINSLDGDKKTIVCLEGQGEMHMDIGGGGPSGCVVALTYDKQKFYTLINPAVTGENVELKVGGAPRPYPAEMLVPKELALKAAKTFSESGAAEPSLHWRDTADAVPEQTQRSMTAAKT